VAEEAEVGLGGSGLQELRCLGGVGDVTARAGIGGGVKLPVGPGEGRRGEGQRTDHGNRKD